MLRRTIGRLLCWIGIHRWVDSDGDLGWQPARRCACLRCPAISPSPADRAEFVRRRFEVIEGGRQAEAGALSVAELKVLPPPSSNERDRHLDAVIACLEKM